MTRPAGRARTPIQAWERTARDGSATLSAVRAVRDDPGRVWILLDGVRAGVCDRQTADQAGLTAAPMAWTEALADRLDAEVRERLCDRAALRLLAARMRSREGLVRALTQRGHARADAEACADRYAGLGALDDARYAEVLVRNELARKPAGRRLLEAKLRAHGVRGDAASHALDEAMDGRDELEDARRVARSAARSLGRADPDAARRRLTGRLLRRGFSGPVVRQAVDEALREAGGP